MIFGLPETTVLIFAIAVGLILLLLTLWGIFFPRVRDE